MSLPVAILAGGEAQRLRPVTQSIPKALVEVAGRPFIDYQLRYLKAQGFEEVVLCVGYLGDQIEAAVRDGSAFDLNVRYSYDGPKLLGTGGALKRAAPLLGDRFFVFYGDTYLPIDFGEVARRYAASAKPALITVFRNSGQWDTSNVSFRDGVVLEYNKRRPKQGMDYIDYGLAVVSASILDNVVEGQIVDLGEIYHDLSLRGLLQGHEVFNRFHEIGSPEGLREAEDFFSSQGAL